jgi:predicted permease
MSYLGRGIRAGVRRLFHIPLHREQLVRDDADRELDAFVAARIEALVARGMTRDEALAEALRRLGSSIDEARTLLHHSASHRERRMSLRDRFDSLVHDVRYAMRGLRARPGFSAAVIVTLGLGIGANSAMFSIVDRLLFRPPNFLRDADAVHRIYFGRTFDGTERITRNFQYRRYRELTDWTTSFDRTATFFLDDQTPVGDGADARPRPVAGVSASFFQFFDTAPTLGRWFTAVEDSSPAGTPVAVLSYAYWQSQFGGAGDVVGKTVHIGPLRYTVVGVAPKDFTGLSVRPPIAFIPITSMGATLNGSAPSTMYFKTYNMSWVEMIAHRRAGVTIEAATTDLTTAYRRSYAVQKEENPRTLPIESTKPHAIAGPVLTERGPDQGSDSKVATWLIGVTAIVLLVACANVANLLLARAFGRRREIAVRLALGVSQMRLVSQLLTESVLLAVLGGVLGLLVAQTGGSVLRMLFLPDALWTPALADGRTLAFTAAIVLVTGILAGIAPALHARRSDVAESLKSGVREGTYHRSRTRNALMVAQGALSVVLLVGAGLFVRSLQQVHNVRLGFDPDRLIYVSADMRGTQLDTLAMAALKTRLVERAASIPGVEHATRAVTVPFWQTINSNLYVPGVDSTSRFGEFDLQAASADYFVTAGTRLLRGRGIEATDVAGSPLIIVVSEPMARVLWPGQDAIGKCVKLNADTMPCRTVVGIAEEVRSELRGHDRIFHYFVPIAQWRADRGGLFVRTRDAAKHAEAIRRELQSLMPGDSYLQALPLKDVFDPVVRSWKLGATLFVVFGVLALVLATLGLYSVIAYSVAQRAHELGVRVALGALVRDVLQLVLRQGLRLAAAGVVLGSVIALWAGKFVKPLLFEVSPRDPVVFVLVIVSLLGAALVASLIPAIRATRVDPISALRGD